MSREGNQFKEAGRFTKSPAPELINSAFTVEVNEGTLLYHGMSLADLAHAIMLIEIDVVPQESRAALLNALLDMHNLSVENIDFDNVSRFPSQYFLSFPNVSYFCKSLKGVQ